MTFLKDRIFWGLIGAGILFSLYLVWQIPQGAYFSGDGGLKALLTQQLSRGELRFDLVPPESDWIRRLWQAGLYPYQEPFVYYLNERYYITFPYTLSLVTAPFYALLGYRGLYVIPLVATWIIWFTFSFACQLLEFQPWQRNYALVTLIFASPLTLYSAIYWEHTLAIALAFAGITLLMIGRMGNGGEDTGREPASRLQVSVAVCEGNLRSSKAPSHLTVFSGVLLGLSVWFRPEFLCAIALIILGLYLPTLLTLIPSASFQSWTTGFFGQNTKNKGIFVISAIVTVFLFFLANKLIYGHFLGIHGIQVVEQSSLEDKIKEFWQSFQGLSVTFLAFFPVTYFAIVYGLLKLVYKDRIAGNSKQILAVYLACLLFVMGVSLLVPPGTAGLIPGGKQWGTRFLLLLIPIITLVTFKELNLISSSYNKYFKYFSLFVISIFFLISLHKNLYLGTQFLEKNYRQLQPILNLVNNTSLNVIAISNQFVGQVLEPATDGNKIFFLVENNQQLRQLSASLLEQNQSKFIYICYPFRPCKLPEKTAQELVFERGNQQYFIKFTSLGNLGKYPVYEGVITLVIT